MDSDSERDPDGARDPVEALDAVASAGRRVSDSGYGRFAAVGLQYAATLGLFAWGGHALDAHFETKPMLLILGVFLGFAGGTLSLVRKVPPVQSRSAAEKDRAEDSIATEHSDSEPPPSA